MTKCGSEITNSWPWAKHQGMETGMYFWIVILKQGIQFHDRVIWNFSASQIPFSKLKIIFIQHRHSQSKILLLYLTLYAYIIHDCWNAAPTRHLNCKWETRCELINSPWGGFFFFCLKHPSIQLGKITSQLHAWSPWITGSSPLQCHPSWKVQEVCSGKGTPPTASLPPWPLLQLSGTHRGFGLISQLSQRLGLSKHREFLLCGSGPWQGWITSCSLWQEPSDYYQEI